MCFFFLNFVEYISVQIDKCNFIFFNFTSKLPLMWCKIHSKYMVQYPTAPLSGWSMWSERGKINQIKVLSRLQNQKISTFTPPFSPFKKMGLTVLFGSLTYYGLWTTTDWWLISHETEIVELYKTTIHCENNAKSLAPRGNMGSVLYRNCNISKKYY